MSRYEMTMVVTKDGETIASEVNVTATGEPGWRCAHAAISDDLYRDCEGEPCRWCVSQGKDGTLVAVEVVRCPHCYNVIAADEIAKHWMNGCEEW